MQHRLPIRKSKKEIDTYIDNGIIFGDILFRLYNKIIHGEPQNSLHIEDMFYEMTREVDNTIWRSATYPFAQQVNYLGDKFNCLACVSVNDKIAHCKPNKKQFQKGDIISVDVGIALPAANTNKWLHFDSAFTATWDSAPEDWILAPHRALANIIDEQPQTTYRVAKVIQNTAIAEKLDTVVMLTGHGIGYSLHEEPHIRNAPGRYSNTSFFNGLCFCAEPIFVLPGKQREASYIARAYVDSDGWSVRTVNSQPSSHFETMFCIINNKLVDICGITKWFC